MITLTIEELSGKRKSLVPDEGEFLKRAEQKELSYQAVKRNNPNQKESTHQTNAWLDNTASVVAAAKTTDSTHPFTVQYWHGKEMRTAKVTKDYMEYILADDVCQECILEEEYFESGKMKVFPKYYLRHEFEKAVFVRIKMKVTECTFKMGKPPFVPPKRKPYEAPPNPQEIRGRTREEEDRYESYKDYIIQFSDASSAGEMPPGGFARLQGDLNGTYWNHELISFTAVDVNGLGVPIRQKMLKEVYPAEFISDCIEAAENITRSAYMDVSNFKSVAKGRDVIPIAKFRIEIKRNWDLQHNRAEADDKRLDPFFEYEQGDTSNPEGLIHVDAFDAEDELIHDCLDWHWVADHYQGFWEAYQRAMLEVLECSVAIPPGDPSCCASNGAFAMEPGDQAPVMRYRQRKNSHTCMVSSLCSALFHWDCPLEARGIHSAAIVRQKGKPAGTVNPGDFNNIVKRYKMKLHTFDPKNKRFHPLEDPADCPVVARLKGTNHCVTFFRGYIFEPSLSHALPCCEQNLQMICGNQYVGLKWAKELRK